jgi:hypothetical protein
MKPQGTGEKWGVKAKDKRYWASECVEGTKEKGRKTRVVLEEV